MSIPAGKEEDFNFGYDVGFQEAWEILNSAISAEGEEQMTDVTKDLLEALKAAQAYVCGPTAWTQEQEDTTTTTTTSLTPIIIIIMISSYSYIHTIKPQT